jgi:hypothetical protein
MAARTATNPDTGKQVIFVGNQWVPVERTATNPDTGVKAYFAANQWIVGDRLAQEETSLFGYVPETLKAIGAGGAGMVESALTGAAFLLPEEAEQAARRKIAEVGGDVQEFFAPDEAYEGTYLDLMRGVGSTLPFLAAGFAGIPGAIAGVGMGVGAGAGEAAQRAEAAGATEEQISRAAGYGMIPGALEMVAPTRIIGRARRALGPNTGEIADALNNSFRSRLARMSQGKLGSVTKAAMEEAAQEASSEVLQNLISQGVYDPNTGTFEGVGESAKIGGGVGAILSLFTDIIIPGGRRAATRATPTEEAPTEPAEEPSIEGGLFGGQAVASVLDADTLEELGLDLDKSTANRLFGLDLADPEQRAEAETILTNYVENPLVQNNKPEVVSRIRQRILSPLAADLTPTEEPPLEERIRVRPPAEVQPDLIDIAEEEQIQELLDEDELAQMQAEEDAQLAEREAAEAEIAAAQQEMELSEADRRVAERRQQESVEKRRQVLLPIIERQDIDGVENLRRAFSAELGRQGFTNTEPTQDELTLINRAADVREALDIQEMEQAGEEALREVVRAEDQAASRAELEALIPERREAPATAEPTEQELQRAEKARLNRERMDSIGRGTEGQLEFPAIEREEKAAARLAEPTTVEEAPKVQKADKRFFDRLGVAPQAPIRKAVRGMDVTSEQVRTALSNLGRNRNVAEQTKVSINNFLQQTPEAAAQQDLFVPTRPRPTALEREQATRRAEREAARQARAEQAAAEPIPTPEPTPTPDALEPTPTTTAATPTTTTAPTTTAPKAPTRRTVTRRTPAKPAAEQTPIEKVQAFKLNKNNKYTQKGAMKYYLDLADGDMDLALREIAFDAIKPKESTIKSTEARRRSKAARSWVETNMPESVTALNEQTEQAGIEEEARVKADLRRSPTGRAKDAVARSREVKAQERETINSYVNPKENPGNNDQMVQEAVDDLIAYQNETLGTAEETLAADDKQAIREALGIDIAAFEGDITQHLEADAVAATIAEANQKVADAIEAKDIGAALTQIFETSPNRKVRKVAKRLSETIKGVTVETTSELNNAKGNPIAAIYEPSTNKIVINTSVPLSTHAVLHESAHAVTYAVLQNKSHPATAALTKLYNDLKGAMPDEYGMRSLEDFVAEAFTNPEFQAKLAAYKPTGQKITGWERFWGAIAKFLGIADNARTADVETIKHINTILGTEPNTRNVTDVPNALAKGKPEEAVTHMMSGGKEFLKDSPPNKVEDILEWGKLASGRARAFFLNGVGLEAITDVIKSKIPSAKEIEKLLYQVEGVRVEYMKKYTNLLNDAYRTFKNDSAAKAIFNKLVSFSTINRIDPTVNEDKIRKYWVVYGAYNSKTDARTRKEEKFNTKAQMEKRVAELEAQREADRKAGREASIVGRIIPKEPNPQAIADYEEVVSLFKQLTPEQRAVYTNLRDFYSELNDKIIAAEEANIDKLETEAEVKKTIRDDMFMRRLEAGFIEPYFPLTRSGTYWLEFNYRDENGQIVYATGSYDSWLQRRRAMNKLKELPEVDTKSVRARPRAEIEQRVYNNEVPLPFLTDLRKKINALDIKDKEGKRQVNEFLADVMLRALPEQALVQSRQVRQNIAFFEGDALESFQQKAPRFITSYANLEHVVDLEIAGKKVRNERDKLGEDDSFVYDAATIVAGTREETKEMPILSGVPSYLQFAKNPLIANWARMARSGTFIWTLGVNLSSVAVNMSIIPMVLQSRLAGEYGGIKATKSTALAGALYTATFGKVSREGITGVDEKGKQLEETKMLRELGGFGLTNDIDRDTQIGKVLSKFDKLAEKFKDYGFDARSATTETADLDNPNSTLLTKAVYWSGFLFNHSERAIRQTSAMSVYMLEMEKLTGKAFKDITEAEFNSLGEQAAQKAIDTTLWINTSASLTTAPRIAQTSVGSLVWQFKRVPAQFMYTHLRMVKTLFDDMTGRARTEAEREEARILRNMFFYLSATGGAMVGVKGIPMYGVVAAIANMFLDDDEDDFNTMIAKMIGQDKFYGLIASQLGIDLTDRISLTNLMIRDRGNYKPTNETEALIEAWAGPTYGVTKRFYDGMESLLDDNPRNKDRAIEAILPTGASNIAKSYRFATKGYETGREDAIISGELPASDILKQAMGFSPASTRAARDRLALNIRKETGRKERKAGILDKIAYALDPDTPRPELYKEAFEEIMAYNRDHPATAIDYRTVIRSLKSRATRSAFAGITGGMPISDRRALLEIMQSDAEFADGTDWLSSDL